MRLFEYFWYRIRPVHLVLIPLSLLFGAAAALRRRAYRLGWLQSVGVGVPVIVVGNISVGGTGKTPAVLWLVDLLRNSGYHPGIVTRGYGGSEQLQEVRGDSDVHKTGDEPLLMARRANVPVFAGRKRPRGRAGSAADASAVQCHRERRWPAALRVGPRHRARCGRCAAQIRQWLAAARGSPARTGRQTRRDHRGRGQRRGGAHRRARAVGIGCA